MDNKTNRNKLVLYLAFACLLIVLCIFIYFTYYTPPCRWSRKLVNAIKENDTYTALALIDEGTQKGYSMDTFTFNASGYTTILEMSPERPLNVACHEGNYAVAEKLLQEGASAKPTVKGEWNPIYYVLIRRYSHSDIAIIQLLIDYGAKVDYDDYTGYPILLAVQRYWLEAVDNVSISEEEISQGLTEVFIFIAQYTDYSVKDSAERNALHYAAIYHNWNLIKILIEDYGFNIKNEDKWGNTAYDLALDEYAPDYILEMLKP